LFLFLAPRCGTCKGRGRREWIGIRWDVEKECKTRETKQCKNVGLPRHGQMCTVRAKRVKGWVDVGDEFEEEVG